MADGALQWTLVSVFGTILFFLLVFYTQPMPLIRIIQHIFYPKVFFYFPTEKPICALTIDDAPCPATPGILDVLASHKVKATFFMISSQFKGNETTLKRIVDEGHEMGNHMVQNRASWCLSPEEFEKRLSQCDKAIREYDPSFGANGKTKWFRPGHGFFSGSMLKCTSKHNYKTVLGNVFPNDVHCRSSFVNSLYLVNRVTPGSIIVLHSRDWTVPTLEKSLREIKKRFQVVSLSQLEEQLNAPDLN